MRELQEPEYSQVWHAFEKAFRFRPGVGGQFPGIDEPIPSVTFELPREYPIEDLVKMGETLRSALRTCTRPGEEVYYLDWQHECYAFEPHSATRTWFNGFPDGDCAIYLAKDLSFGTFGHPWERTICCFGEKFIQAILGRQPRLFRNEKRRKRGHSPSI